jgi:hypothetical protein
VPRFLKLRSRDALELGICYGLIVSVIWTSGLTHRFLFWVAFAWILATTLVSPGDARTLGLRPSGWRSWLLIVSSSLGFAGLVAGVALELNTLHPLHGAGFFGWHVAGYLLWALEQQFILQDYVLLRLLRILPNQSAALIAAAVLFSIAHLPSPVLTLATFAWGIAACALFLRYRNLHALGLAHGILGLCIAVSVPDVLTHHMMVGAGYLHYRQ